jgi:hypothetical protein
VDAFSYLSVLLSIILGLGLTQLLTAVGRLIRHRDRVRLDWLPLLWAAVLLVVYVQTWWAMFGLRNVREWTFVATLVVSIAKDLVIGRRLPSPVNLAFHGVLGALCVSAMTVGRRRVHEAIGIAGAAAIAMYMSLLFMRLR